MDDNALTETNTPKKTYYGRIVFHLLASDANYYAGSLLALEHTRDPDTVPDCHMLQIPPPTSAVNQAGELKKLDDSSYTDLL
jgi:hypothetical protein